MSENYFYSSLSGQEIEDTLLGSVRGDVAQARSNLWKAQARQNIGAGSESTGFQVLGYYDTLQDLIDSLQVLPQPGDAYGIGTEPPYHIYVYDGTTDSWLDNGTLNVDVVIDDNDTSNVSTWSSSKISSEIAGASEIDDTTTSADTTWSSNKILQVVYPVGSIYMSVNSSSPATLFGFGTWEQIKDTFLLSAGDTYSAGATGGEATHLLTSSESGVPSHTHSGVVGGNNGSTRLQSAKANLSGSTSEAWASWFGTGYNAINNVYVQTNTAANASQAHNNMPPYLVVYVWKRTA